MTPVKGTLQERLEKWRTEKGKQPRCNKPWLPNRKRVLACKNINTEVGTEVPETPAGSYTAFKRNLIKKASPKNIELKDATKAVKDNETSSSSLKFSARQLRAFQGEDKENVDNKEMANVKELARRHRLEEWKNERRKTIAAIPCKSTAVNKGTQIIVRQTKSSLQRQAMISQKKTEVSMKITPSKKTTTKPGSLHKITSLDNVKLNLKPQRRQTLHITKELASYNNRTKKTLSPPTKNSSGIHKLKQNRSSLLAQQPKKVDFLQNKSTNQANVTNKKQNIKDQKPPVSKRRYSSFGPGIPINRKIIPVTTKIDVKSHTSTNVSSQSKDVSNKKSPQQASSNLLTKKKRSTWSKQGHALDFNHLRANETTVSSLAEIDASRHSKKLRSSCHSSILKSAEKSGRKSLKSVAFEIGNASHKSGSPSTRRRLSSWLDDNNKKPSSFRHLHCFNVQLSDLKRRKTSLYFNNSKSSCVDTHNRSLDRDQSFMKTPPKTDLSLSFHLEEKHQSRPTGKVPLTRDNVNLQTTLENISILLNTSCCPQEVSLWLDEIYEHVQDVRRLALYWECRSQVSELIGNTQEALRLIDQGLEIGAEPCEVLQTRRMIVLDRLHRNTSLPPPPTRTTTTKEIDSRNSFSSTVIQYQVRDKTPVYKKLCDETNMNPMELLVATPVRRSNRLSASTPRNLETPSFKSTMCVSSLEHLPLEFQRKMILVPNPSLQLLHESPPQHDFLHDL